MPCKPNQFKQSLIASRKKIIDHLCEVIYQIYTANNNKIPYRTFTSIVEQYKQDFPTLKASMLSMAFCRYKKKRKRQSATIPLTNTVLDIDLQDESIPNTVFVSDEASTTTTSTLSNVSELANANNRNKGGRPKGITLLAQEQLQQCIVYAKNEITEKYKKNCC